MAHSVNFFSRVSTRSIFTLAFAAAILSLAACGGGGGSVTTDPVVTPVAVVAKATVITEVAADGSVKLTSDYPMSTASFSWTGVDGNKVTAVGTLSADKKSATATIGGMAAKIPEGVTVVNYTTTYPDGFPPAVAAFASFTWCPTGTSVNGTGKCMVPEWTQVFSGVDANPANSETRVFFIVDGAAKDVKVDLIKYNIGVQYCGKRDTRGPHGGMVVSCNGYASRLQDTGTYEVAPNGFFLRINGVDEQSTAPYARASARTWTGGICINSAQIPGTSICTDGQTYMLNGVIIKVYGLIAASAD